MEPEPESSAPPGSPVDERADAPLPAGALEANADPVGPLAQFVAGALADVARLVAAEPAPPLGDPTEDVVNDVLSNVADLLEDVPDQALPQLLAALLSLVAAFRRITST